MGIPNGIIYSNAEQTGTTYEISTNGTTIYLIMSQYNLNINLHVWLPDSSTVPCPLGAAKASWSKVIT